jgi:uncharacterized protein YbjT (DUF2867 family)
MAGQVIVIGGTQGTGEHIARKLARSSMKVTVMARDPAKAKRVFRGTDITVVMGDLTDPVSLKLDYSNFDFTILTAGVTKRPAGVSLVRAVEYDGTLSLLDALYNGGFNGRLLYMNSIGGSHRTWFSALLNLIKGKTLVWREMAEEAIRESGIAFTILRAGILNDQPAGTHELLISSERIALTPGTKISRDDMADAFVAALDNPATANHAFSIIWGAAGTRESLEETFGDAIATDQ